MRPGRLGVPPTALLRSNLIGRPEFLAHFFRAGIGGERALTMASLTPCASNEASAAAVVPPFDVTRSRSTHALSSDCAANCAAPANVPSASARPCSSAHAEAARRFLHRFDEIEHVGRAAARDRGDGVDLRFVVEPDGRRQRRRGLRRQRASRFVDARKRGESRHAHADQRRRIRHRANDARIAAEPAREVRAANAGRDAHHELRR